MLKVLQNIQRWKWKWLLALVYPVSWKQDTLMHNKGYDIILLSKGKGYFTGTYFQRQKLIF